MFWLGLILIVLTLAVILLAWWLLPAISTYAARYYCGAVFASERKLEDIEKDLFFVPISLAQCKVDFEAKTVRASVGGFARRKAKYDKDRGIRLIRKAVQLPPPRLKKSAINQRNPLSEAIHLELNAWLKPFTQTETGQTHATVVLHRGNLIAEAYAPGIGPETPLHSWSLTKSLTNALAGILISRGKLSLDQHPDIPAWAKDGRRDITVRHLLQMTSGLDWKETEKEYLKVSRMLFMEPDVVRFARSVKLAHPPGSHFAYASCNTNVLSGMIRKLFASEADYLDFPRKALFEPLGMDRTLMETDPAGNLVGSSFSMGTARNWARFGQLYLNEGRIGSTQFLPREWISFSRESSEAAAGKYGAHFWLNRSGELPDLPPEMYYAAGFLGQRISIFPDQELVVVRMGLGFDAQFDHNRFLLGILDLLEA